MGVGRDWWEPCVYAMCAVLCLVAQSCPTLCDPMDFSLRGSSVHGDSPGKNTGVGCYALLQGIVPTQRSNLSLLLCRWILYHLGHQGSPRILERVTYPFSRGSSQPRNRIRVSCIAGGFFTSWVQEDVSSIPSSCVRGIGICPLGGKISRLRTTGLIPSYLLRKLAILLIPFSFPLPSTSTPLNSYCFKNFIYFWLWFFAAVWAISSFTEQVLISICGGWASPAAESRL